MRKGSWDIDARVDDMNANGILASLNFPSVVKFDGELFHQFENKQDALTLLQAYNDWHIDEWCGSHRSEEHTSELQSLMRISYAVFCLKKKNKKNYKQSVHITNNIL